MIVHLDEMNLLIERLENDDALYQRISLTAVEPKNRVNFWYWTRFEHLGRDHVYTEEEVKSLQKGIVPSHMMVDDLDNYTSY